MKAKIMVFVSLSLLLIVGKGQTTAGSTHTERSARKAGIVANYGSLPLAFEDNRGQLASQVKFLSRGAGYSLFLTKEEAVLRLRKVAELKPQMPGGNVLPQEEQAAVLRMKLLGANDRAEVAGQDELPGKSNYFIGNDAKKWQTDVRQYAKVRYSSIYPGIDLIYYGKQRELEYDFVVQPGADPNAIRLAISGARTLELDHGDVMLSTASGKVHLRSPNVYQEVNGRRVEIPAQYVTKLNNEVGLRISAYDRGKPLVIDPILSYSTYLGGSAVEMAQNIAVDGAGNAYVTGSTVSTDFPVVDPFQSDFHGGGRGTGEGDVFVSKINPDGSALIFST